MFACELRVKWKRAPSSMFQRIKYGEFHCLLSLSLNKDNKYINTNALVNSYLFDPIFYKYYLIYYVFIDIRNNLPFSIALYSNSKVIEDHCTERTIELISTTYAKVICDSSFLFGINEHQISHMYICNIALYFM